MSRRPYPCYLQEGHFSIIVCGANPCSRVEAAIPLGPDIALKILKGTSMRPTLESCLGKKVQWDAVDKLRDVLGQFLCILWAAHTA